MQYSLFAILNLRFNSINQGIDIGQVEGAFVQGMGYFLTEKVVYDPESGVQLTTNTWVSSHFGNIKFSSNIFLLCQELVVILMRNKDPGFFLSSLL